MIKRFEIPKEIRNILSYKGKSLRELSGHDLTVVYEGLKRIRGKENEPKITIAIPAFNEEKILYATLLSISLQEDVSGVEVLVIDNNSTDRTAELSWKCGAKVLTEKKQGVAFARDLALMKSKGSIYISCDADTLYPRKWLDLLIKPLIQSDSCSTSYSLHCQYDEGQNYHLSFYLYQFAKHMFFFIRHFKRAQLNCGGASMAFRVNQALAIGGYNTDLSRGEDGYLALKLSSFGQIKMVRSKKAFIYTSNRRALQDESLGQAFSKRALKGFRNSLSFLTKQKIPTS